MFVGREREMKVLRAEYDRRGGAFVPVYGRRRVGKSRLILEFMDELPAIYMLGKQAPPELQRARRSLALPGRPLRLSGSR